MNLEIFPLSIIYKEKREMDYIKGVHKRRFQSEVESYEDSEDEDKRDSIKVQDILIIDRVSF